LMIGGKKGKKMNRAIAAVVLVGVILFGGYLIGHYTNQPKIEDVTPTPAQSQPDGSVIAERRQPATRKAPHTIPNGATEERRAQVTIKPPAPVLGDCPPVTVDLSLVRDDNGRRIVASSPDGQVISAIDMPIEAGVMPISRPWSAGVSYGTDRTQGAWIERDLGRVRVGAEAIRETGGAVMVRARVGWSF